MEEKDVSAAVFDFDNVIALGKDGIGSEEVKDAAWPKVFGKDWPHVKDAFSVFVDKYRGGKGSRFDIVRDALVHLRFSGDLEKEVQELCEQFNRFVQKGILELGVPPETRAFLEKLSKHLPLFINSATPAEAMEETLKKLGIRGFFTEVYGQEDGKAESLHRAMKTVGESDPKNVLFAGDSLSDYEAAKTVGTLFVGVTTKRNGWVDGKEPFPVVTAVSEIRL